MANRVSLAVAVISNPHSWRNRASNHLAELCHILRFYPNVTHYIPPHLRELEEIINQVIQDKPDLIILNGGDGTIHHILSLLYQKTGFSNLPLLALMTGGTTNLIAGELGLKISVAQLLEKIDQQGLEKLNVLAKPAMVLNHSAMAVPKIGFFFGTAAFTNATISSRQHIRVKTIKSTLSVLFPLVRSVWQAIKMTIGLGAPTDQDQSLYQGYPAKITLENRLPILSKQTLFLATTLSRMSFGLKVFWGKGEWAIRYLSVPFPAFRWLFAIWPILRGRPTAWMIKHDYQSGRTGKIVVGINCPSFFDGEEIPVSDVHPIELLISPIIPFVIS